MKKYNYKQMETFQQDLQFEYAKRLAKWEVAVSLADFGIYISDKKEREIIHYMMSTNLRWAFMLTTAIASMENTFYGVTDTRKQLGASRAAIDAMVNECEEAGWITVKRDKKNHRSIQATDITVKTWIVFAQMNSDLSANLRLSVISNVLQEIRTETNSNGGGC